MLMVHLLDMDGDLSAHSTVKMAVEHYIREWGSDKSIMKDLVNRIKHWTAHRQHKAAMLKALKTNDMSQIEEDFPLEDFLDCCEDVCHYTELEMKKAYC